jgi:hypothetical protein
MEEKVNGIICNFCNKKYKSYASRSNHIKKYHNTPVIPDVIPAVIPKVNSENINKDDDKFDCSKCNKLFNNRQNKWKHEKKCCKNIITQTNINSHNTINNTINNNFYVNGLGFENISLLSYDNINEIYKSNRNCLIKFIELLNFNEGFPENHTFCNTSLEGKYVSFIDNKNNKISKMNKLDCYDLVLSNSLKNINIILDSLRNKMKPKDYEKIANLINDTKQMYLINKDSKNIYNTQINQIAYNNKELILESWKNAHIKEIEDEEDELITDNSESSSDEDDGNLKFNVKKTSNLIKIDKKIII